MSNFVEGLAELSNGYVRINFEKSDETNTHKLKDAITLKKDVYDSMSAEEIEAIKQDRFDKWLESVTKEPENIIEVEGVYYIEVPEEYKDENSIEVNGLWYNIVEDAQ